MPGTLSATLARAISSVPRNADLSAYGDLAAQSLVPVLAVSSAFSSAGALGASGIANYLRSAPLVGAGALSATDTQKYAVGPALGSTGQLTGTVVSARLILTDTFNRSNSTTALGTPSGGGSWVARQGVMGIETNAAYPVTVDNYSEVTHGTILSSDDMAVTVTLGTGVGPDTALWLTLGANAFGERVCGHYTFSSCGIYSNTTTGGWIGSDETARGVSYMPTYTPVAGDVIMFHRIGNVYTMVLNSTILLAKWTDSGDVVPRDFSHRIVGVGGFNNASQYWRADSWQAEENPAALPFLTFSEENTVRTSQPVPTGCSGCYLTAVGAGGGGGSSRRGTSGTAVGGGGGGGGGGDVRRTFIPVANLGSTYSVTGQFSSNTLGGAAVSTTANGNPGTTGGNTTFSSGATTVTCGGGGGGGGGTSSTATGGAGGVVSGSLSGINGTAGGTGQATVAGTAGTNSGATNSSPSGGGGGGGVTTGGTRSAGGNGGSTSGIAGGLGGAVAANGAASLTAAGAYPNAGGGGGGGATATQGRSGGIGSGAGAGGGGGGALQLSSGPSGTGGVGGQSYLKIEWV